MNMFSTAGAIGILYAEDFGHAAAPPPPQPPLPLEAWAPPPGLTQLDVDAACLRAVRAAEQAWHESEAVRRTLALETIGAGLAAVRQAAAAEDESLAESLARAMLGLLSAALPEVCRAHGDAEVRALLRRLLPVVGRKAGVVVRLHAGLMEAVAADLAALDDSLAGTVELRAANLPPGDVRLSWPEGGLVRDTAALHAAMADCLSQLGLLDGPALSVPDSRSPAHALTH